MCSSNIPIIGPLFAKPPKMPALSTAPGPVPSPSNPETAKAMSGARAKMRAAAVLAQGRSSTIFTSGLGLTSPASTAPKTVLGA